MNGYIDSSAQLSDCGLFRMLLARVMNPELPLLMWVCLNPSTADDREDDNSVRKMKAMTNLLGFGGFLLANLFAYRTKNPKVLKAAGYPRHEAEDEALRVALLSVRGVVCGWGGNAAGHPRAGEVLQLIKQHAQTSGRDELMPRALKINADGTPAHPLYMPYRLASDYQAMPRL